MKKVLATIMALALMVACLAGCAGGNTATTATEAVNSYDRIQKNGYMTVGIDPTIENIIFTEAGETEPTGFIPDIVRGFAEQLGVEVRWEILEWSAMLTAVNTGKVDFIAANMNMRLDREAAIDFSDPWLVDSAMWCVAKDSKYQTVEDLQEPGTKFGIASGSVYEALIAEQFPNAQIVVLPLGTWQESLASGVIDVSMDDSIVFAGPMTENENLRLLADRGESYLYGFAFASGDKTVEVFNLYLTKLKAFGTYAQLFKTWMGFDWAPITAGVAY
ncbi:MAG: ABC transporter substrate-binding protein [Eubacteriales bacterium]|nr:ABC transporter substrate-binding protein [Eubacteriales bacterium]